MAVTSRDLHTTTTLRRQVIRPTPVARTYPSTSRLPYLITLFMCGFALLMVSNTLITWGQTKIDDFRYGRPRTTHLAGWVGHNEATGSMTQFIAMNMDRQVVVFEIPGGDVGQARTLKGPYLFGANENLTPVHLELQYINADKDPDLVISVKDEQILYINEQGSFRLMTPQERTDLERTRR